MISFVYKNWTIIFCDDVREHNLEVVIYNASDKTLLLEIGKGKSFDELYNYQIQPIEIVIQNGALTIQKYFENQLT